MSCELHRLFQYLKNDLFYTAKTVIKDGWLSSQISGQMVYSIICKREIVIRHIPDSPDRIFVSVFIYFYILFQKIFVIFVFSEHHVEQLISFIG